MQAKKRLIDADGLRRRILAFATGLRSEVLPVDTVIMLLTQMQDVDPVRRWIPVTERLPEKLTPVLIRHNYMEWAGTTVGYITTGGYWEWFAYFMGDDALHYPMGGGTICPGSEYVTHWMPLQELPKEDAK